MRVCESVGQAVEFAENQHAWHHFAPGDDAAHPYHVQPDPPDRPIRRIKPVVERCWPSWARTSTPYTRHWPAERAPGASAQGDGTYGPCTRSAASASSARGSATTFSSSSSSISTLTMRLPPQRVSWAWRPSRPCGPGAPRVGGRLVGFIAARLSVEIGLGVASRRW
jgi:hypothetical protein